jgi:hypothetical protein
MNKRYSWPKPTKGINEMKTKSCRRLFVIAGLIGEAKTQDEYNRISFLLKRHISIMERIEKALNSNKAC